MSEAISRARNAREVVALTVKSATVRYVGGVFVLLCLGMAGQVVAITVLRPGTTASELVRDFSEAALVSALLALLVDPYLKRRLQDESGWHALFGFLNPKAPMELREAIRELADCRRYYSATHWTIDYTWHDDARTVLAVTLEVANTGVNIDTKAYKPNGKPWVLASCDGMPTEYLHYSISCPRYFTRLDAQGDDLRRHVVVRADGSIYVNEGDLVGNRAVPPGESFETFKRTRMFRHTTAYLPIHHTQFIDRLRFTLKGPALQDLEVTISHPREEGRRHPEEWKYTGAAGPVSRLLGRATPGQVTLLWWSPSATQPAGTSNSTNACPSDDTAEARALLLPQSAPLPPNPEELPADE